MLYRLARHRLDELIDKRLSMASIDRESPQHVVSADLSIPVRRADFLNCSRRDEPIRLVCRNEVGMEEVHSVVSIVDALLFRVHSVADAIPATTSTCRSHRDLEKKICHSPT